MSDEIQRESVDLPIPFGWFAVAYTDDVAIGQTHNIRYFEDDIVLWRGEDGNIRALHAYCPHLGAHRGHGGEVVGNDLQCPFHHWRFDRQGAVTSIPYTPAVPPVLKRPCNDERVVEESHGIIYAWHHPDGDAPHWDLMSVPELDSGEWVRFERRDWIIPIHTQEITENGSDYAHFASVHGTKSPPEPEWKLTGYTRESLVKTKMETPRGIIDGSIHIRNTGPGQSFVKFGGISELMLSNLPTPIDGKTTHLRQDFFMPKSLDEKGQRSAVAVAKNVIFQLEQDIPIWEHKRYLIRPLLVKGDGPILAYRKQYAQYYARSVPESEVMEELA